MTAPRHRWPFVVGTIAILLVAGALLFQWDWLIPFAQSRASAAAGRTVTIQHLHVSLGRKTRIEAEGVTIGNPPDWPGGGDFATIERLGIDVLPLDYIQHRQLTLPVIDLQSPKVDAQQMKDGKNNWTFGSSEASHDTSPGPKLGTLRVADGHVHARSQKLDADFQVALETQDSKDGTGQIAAKADGKYAGKPINAQFLGGALLSLRDTTTPYPVDLKLANGPTKVNLVGTVKDPLAFEGANLKLEFAGPDMSLLLALTGLAIPKTPAYRVTGQLDYADGVVKFLHSVGRVGSTDLEGDVEVDTKPDRPVVHATLQSKLVDLKDLAGFIGAEPGDAAKGTKAVTKNDGRLLPNDPISLPKLNATDVHLQYKAARIQGRSQPLDNMNATLDIVNGAVHVHPLSFGIGRGQISADIALDEKGQGVHAKTTIDFKQMDLDRLLSASGIARGAGAVSGRAVIDGTGRSLAEILGRGNGELKLYMGRGGNVSALLVDLSGLQFGNAVLSALGVPDRATIQCMVIDMSLQQGTVSTRAAFLDTDESRIGMGGGANLRTEALSLKLETDAKHFSVGTLPTPINIKGTLASPSIAPEVGPLAIRGGAAIALGIIGTPLAALLPTIQFGTGEDGACNRVPRPATAQTRPAAPRR